MRLLGTTIQFKDGISADYERINLDFILRVTDPGGMYKDQAFSLSVLDDVSDNPLPPPPPEEPTNPLTVSVSDTGWDLYKDVLF